MKITFVSNFYNHHQAPLSECFYDITDGKYRFIATTEVPEERKNMGYSEEKPDFVSMMNDEGCQDAINNSDILITGGVEEKRLKARKKNGKIIFRYSERPFKKKLSLLQLIYRYCRWHMENPRKAKIYTLCASAYASADYSKVGLYKDRMLKWGYFPEYRKYESPELIVKKKNKKEILWCGRFLDWKHPDDALLAAERLYKEGYEFHMSFIGTGPLKQKLTEYSKEKKLDSCVEFCGTMSPDKVRDKMEDAGIYLFTSDFTEGWGAVLNEAMNSGCAVIANKAAGSVPYLIENEKNGYVYENGDTEKMYCLMKNLIENTEEQERVGEEAYKTITTVWNCEIAAERFLHISEKLLKGENIMKEYKTGPCSPAEIIKQK